MLYLRLCFDKRGGSELRAQHVGRHREYIGSHVGAPHGGIEVVQGGPMSASDDLSQQMGSFLVIEAASIEDAKRFHEEDPFTRAGLFERADVVRWDRHIGNPDQTQYVP
jgi:uncharacterized protein YciI